MQLMQVPVEQLAEVWPLVHKHIDDACARSRGRFSAATTFELIAAGDWQLWVVWDEGEKKHLATITTKISEFPTGLRVGEIIICTGEQRNKWVDLISELEEWARANGASVAQVWARKGWTRVMTDYDMTHVLLEKRL